MLHSQIFFDQNKVVDHVKAKYEQKNAWTQSKEQIK